LKKRKKRKCDGSDKKTTVSGINPLQHPRDEESGGISDMCVKEGEKTFTGPIWKGETGSDR